MRRGTRARRFWRDLSTFERSAAVLLAMCGAATVLLVVLALAGVITVSEDVDCRPQVIGKQVYTFCYDRTEP